MPALQDRQRRLIETLRIHGASVIEKLSALPLDVGARDEREPWGPHELVAHIASMEWTYPRLIEVAQTAGAASSDRRSGHWFRDGNDQYNARQLARRRDTPMDDLVDEFARNRRTTVEAVANMDPSLLDAPLTSAGGVTGTLESVLTSVAITHVDEHLQELAQLTR